MKRLFVSMCLVAFVAAGATAQVPDQPYAQPHKGGQRLEMMSQLNLSDNQKTELKAINKDFRDQLTELKKNEDITVREYKSRMETIRKTHHEKIQNLLTDDQKATMKKMMQDRKNEMKKKGEKHLEQMKKDLNLTDDQVATLKKNHEDMAQKMKAIHDNSSLTDDQKKAQMKELRKQEHESMKSVLTPEQMQKLQQQRKGHGHQPVQQ